MFTKAEVVEMEAALQNAARKISRDNLANLGFCLSVSPDSTLQQINETDQGGACAKFVALAASVAIARLLSETKDAANGVG